MLIPAGLNSHADRLTWESRLLSTHERRVRVRVMLLDHSKVTNDFHGLLDGQVNIDTTTDVITSCNISLLDPTQSIGWEPDSPRDFPHLQRMIQAIDERYIPELDDWIGSAVFTGPVQEIDRDGATVSILADSKVRLCMGNFGHNRTWAAKKKVVDIIRDMLVNYAGEAPERIHLPSINTTIPEHLTVHQLDTVWQHVVRLARSVGMVCFFDGRGHFIMRRPSNSVGMTLDRLALCSAVRVDRQAPDIKNRWIVRGPKPKAHKKQVAVRLDLPDNHPWSAQNLGRNGVPRLLIDEQQPGHVKNTAAAHRIAAHARDDQLRTSQQISADVLPMPQIEPYDLVRVVDPIVGTYLLRANQYTLPLGTGGPATLGAIKRVSLQPRHRGKKHHSKGGKS